MRKRVKVGNVVHVEFYDHSDWDIDCDKRPLLFECFGRIIHESNIDYKIATWRYPHGPVDHNTECYSIIKSTITKIRVLSTK